MIANSLILVGGGGHCRSVIDVIESIGMPILGILDKPEFVGTDVLGYPVIGTDDIIPSFADKCEFVITVGQIKDNSIRKRIAGKIESCGGRLATIIAEDAYVSRHASIGCGTVVMHKAVVNAGATVGKNCIINTMADIDHDALVGDFCHISTGVILNGASQVKNDSFIGSGSVVFQGVVIGSNSIIPAGSVVRDSID